MIVDERDGGGRHRRRQGGHRKQANAGGRDQARRDGGQCERAFGDCDVVAGKFSGPVADGTAGDRSRDILRAPDHGTQRGHRRSVLVDRHHQPGQRAVEFGSRHTGGLPDGAENGRGHVVPARSVESADLDPGTAASGTRAAGRGSPEHLGGDLRRGPCGGGYQIGCDRASVRRHPESDTGAAHRQGCGGTDVSTESHGSYCLEPAPNCRSTSAAPPTVTSTGHSTSPAAPTAAKVSAAAGVE